MHRGLLTYGDQRGTSAWAVPVVVEAPGGAIGVTNPLPSVGTADLPAVGTGATVTDDTSPGGYWST
ncbi:hypothetical protein [Salinispora arenicola]|uniref:Uncharacterized protein n=2 Tax=Salinispora arenicola TaxID=168697 RepID=A0ABQ4JXS2_SALAC|nr:hypothetical protein [Salinispora arenicola]MCN0151144.1 hypothetical protein [Salinispora arenicola]GIM86791.1 hypothetical protein Sar04_35270 [Salinispora arenicola]